MTAYIELDPPHIPWYKLRSRHVAAVYMYFLSYLDVVPPNERELLLLNHQRQRQQMKKSEKVPVYRTVKFDPSNTQFFFEEKEGKADDKNKNKKEKYMEKDEDKHEGKRETQWEKMETEEEEREEKKTFVKEASNIFQVEREIRPIIKKSTCSSSTADWPPTNEVDNSRNFHPSFPDDTFSNDDLSTSSSLAVMEPDLTTRSSLESTHSLITHHHFHDTFINSHDDNHNHKSNGSVVSGSDGLDHGDDEDDEEEEAEVEKNKKGQSESFHSHKCFPTISRPSSNSSIHPSGLDTLMIGMEKEKGGDKFGHKNRSIYSFLKARYGEEDLSNAISFSPKKDKQQPRKNQLQKKEIDPEKMDLAHLQFLTSHHHKQKQQQEQAETRKQNEQKLDRQKSTSFKKDNENEERNSNEGSGEEGENRTNPYRQNQTQNHAQTHTQNQNQTILTQEEREKLLSSYPQIARISDDEIRNLMNTNFAVEQGIKSIIFRLIRFW